VATAGTMYTVNDFPFEKRKATYQNEVRIQNIAASGLIKRKKMLGKNIHKSLDAPLDRESRNEKYKVALIRITSRIFVFDKTII
jgi:hypothetical protein